MKIPKYDMILHVLISFLQKFQEIILLFKIIKDNYLTYDARQDQTHNPLLNLQFHNGNKGCKNNFHSKLQYWWIVYRVIVGRIYDQIYQRRTVAISLYKNCKSVILTNLAEK